MMHKIVEGALLRRTPVDTEGFVVTLRLPWNQATYYVANDVSLIGPAHEPPAQYEAENYYGRPAKVVVNGNGLVVAFSVSGTKGYEGLKTIAYNRDPGFLGSLLQKVRNHRWNYRPYSNAPREKFTPTP